MTGPTRFMRHCQRLIDQIGRATEQSERARLEQKLADAIRGVPFEDDNPAREPGDEVAEDLGF